MITAVTYSTADFENARKYNLKMVKKKGNVNQIIEYTEDDIDEEFKEKNKKILSAKRGAGYWLWKVYIVNKAIQEVKDGDYLFYCDSGGFITKDVHIITDYMESKKTDLFCTELELCEGDWTKRDIFIAMDCDREEYFNTPQRCATYFCIKKTEKTLCFLREWLSYAQIYELISDEDNVLYGQNNYIGFMENRHDQSLFSILTKKYGYQAVPDISQYRYPVGFCKRQKEKRKKIEYSIPIMICLHRQKKANVTTRLKEMIIINFPITRRILNRSRRK